MGEYRDLVLKDNIAFDRKVDILNKCFGFDYRAYQKAVVELNEEYCVWVPRMSKGENEPFSKKDNWINIIGKNYIIEKRVDGKDIDYKEHSHKRIVFVKDYHDNTFKYLGVYAIDDSKSTKKESFYKRIKKDIYVEDWNKTQKILFCNLAYMREYNGIKDGDVPVNGGEYVKLNQDALEKYNFASGKTVRGFVETKYKDGFKTGKKPKEIHIEKFDRALSSSNRIDGVKVIFVAKKPGIKEKVVVGYYDDATVYRNRNHYERRGEKLQYNIETKKENAHLISDNIREYLKAPLARINKGVGFGQSNLWYAGTTEKGREVANDLIKKIDYYISNGIEDMEDPGYINNVNETSDDDCKFEGDKPEAKTEAKRIGSVKKHTPNPKKGRIALNKANHRCEYGNEHETFIRRSRDERYTEPHHLIPMSYYDEFEKSIDIPANIVSLCANCHKKIHLGRDTKEMIEELYKARKRRLKKAGIDISIERLLEMYRIK